MRAGRTAEGGEDVLSIEVALAALDERDGHDLNLPSRRGRGRDRQRGLDGAAAEGALGTAALLPRDREACLEAALVEKVLARRDDDLALERG